MVIMDVKPRHKHKKGVIFKVDIFDFAIALG
jgi:hypothetical protein